MLTGDRPTTMRIALPFVFIIATGVLVMLVHDRLFPQFDLNGDNEYYRYAFRELSGFSWADLWNIDLSLERVAGSGSEPVSAIVFYLAAQVMDFRTFHLLLQVLFLISLGICLKRSVENWQIIFLLCVMTFYVFIISTLTKRVAIGMTFLFFGLSVRKYGVIFYVLAVLSHFQIGLFFLAANALSFLQPVPSLRAFQRSERITTGVLVALTLVLLILFAGPLSEKIQSHWQKFGLQRDALKLLVWPILHFVLNRSMDRRSLAAYLAIFVFAIVLGAGRLNFMGYFMFMYLNDSRAILMLHLVLVPYSVYQFLVFADTGYAPGIVTEEMESFCRLRDIDEWWRPGT